MYPGNCILTKVYNVYTGWYRKNENNFINNPAFYVCVCVGGGVRQKFFASDLCVADLEW